MDNIIKKIIKVDGFNFEHAYIIETYDNNFFLLLFKKGLLKIFRIEDILMLSHQINNYKLIDDSQIKDKLFVYELLNQCMREKRIVEKIDDVKINCINFNYFINHSKENNNLKLVNYKNVLTPIENINYYFKGSIDEKKTK